MKYTCPCCGYKALDRKPPGTFEICTICFWQDDKLQFYNPTSKNGSNEISLREAQINFAKIGASRKRFINYVRKPSKRDKRDPKWKVLG